MSETAENTENAPQLGILFVDDETHILSSLRRLVIDEDLEVYTASSGKDGLEILKEQPHIGLIVSDQRMPEMNGAQFLEKARDLAPEALRIILTGYADINATIDAINKGGAHRYLSKPWNDKELLELIRESLRFFSLSQENKRLSKIISEQNDKLKDWNVQLKQRVLQQTATIREKNEELTANYNKLKGYFRGTITAFSSLIEIHSPRMRSHSRNVAEVSTSIAKALKLPAGQCEKIHTAAMLHDIGMIGTPNQLLKMSEDEMSEHDLEEYMRHVIRGQAALDAIEALRSPALLIRHHHEHFDGSGYPDKLAGDKIPLGARIIAAADLIDSEIDLEGEDPIGKVLEKTKEAFGTLLDPRLEPYLEEPVKDCYGKLFQNSQMVEVTTTPHGLREGMKLADDLYTATGLLLLGRGAYLTHSSIQGIMRHHELDPFTDPIRVLVRKTVD